MHMRSKRFGIAVVFAALMALLGTSSPAGAQGVGVAAGVVTGVVEVTPGVPLTGDSGVGTTSCTDWLGQPGINTGFTFRNTVITGGIHNARATGTDFNGAGGVGTINVTANNAGVPSCDSGAAGSGQVDLLTCEAGTTFSANVSTSPPTANANLGGTIDCSALAGRFLRLGPNVVVILTGPITVCGPATGTGIGIGGQVCDTEPFDVAVVAEFVPTDTSGTCDANGLCAVEAQFAGLFAGVPDTAPVSPSLIDL